MGYSQNVEDLDAIDTEYIESSKLPDLETDTLNVLHLNVRGAINKQDSLCRLLRSLGGRNKVSIVSLNETWLRHDTESKFDIPGYNYVGKPRKGRKGGGVCLLLSEEITFRQIDIFPDFETLELICVEIKTKCSLIIVVSLLDHQINH